MLAIIATIVVCLLCAGGTEVCPPCLPCEPCRSTCELEDLFSVKSVDAVSAETGLSERELSTLSIYNPGLVRRFSLGQMSAGSFIFEADVRKICFFLGIFQNIQIGTFLSTLTQFHWILFQLNILRALMELTVSIYPYLVPFSPQFQTIFEQIILLGIFFFFGEAQLHILLWFKHNPNHKCLWDSTFSTQPDQFFSLFLL